MKIGTRIYYDKETGDVIQIVGERSGDVVETTQEQDFAVYAVLTEHVPDTVGMLQLEYGEYASDYAKGGVITRVDLTTLEPLLTYPDLTNPETPQEPSSVLRKEVNVLN